MMKTRHKRVGFAIALCSIGFVSTQAFGVITASSDPNAPGDVSQIGGSPGSGFDIEEDVVLSSGAGHWLKVLSLDQGVSSGTDVHIHEVLHNTGTRPWTDWHEEIISRTVIDIPGGPQNFDAPGFLFRKESVSISADYGNGVVALVEGVDYQLVPHVFLDGTGADSPNSNNGNWEAVWLFFEPGKEIQPGDTLMIDKDIFEVFLNERPWDPQIVAQIIEYPTPEPASLALIIGGIALLAKRRIVS